MSADNKKGRTKTFTKEEEKQFANNIRCELALEIMSIPDESFNKKEFTEKPNMSDRKFADDFAWVLKLIDVDKVVKKSRAKVLRSRKK
ncbi:MAG: hypothetical protein WC223_11050 [Bacteroidales bacterium]|jgi:hypothetical protein